MSNNTKPELVFLDRKGVPMDFNPFSTDNSRKNEAIFASSGAGMRILEVYKENSGGMGALTANAMYEMAKKNAVKYAVIDKGSSISEELTVNDNLINDDL